MDFYFIQQNNQSWDICFYLLIQNSLMKSIEKLHRWYTLLGIIYKTLEPLMTNKQMVLYILSCTITTLLNWDLSIDKNGFSISPTDKTLSEYIQTVDGQCLAGQHVSRLQTAFAGVSTEPGADERLVPSSRGHRTARHHAVVPATWKTMIKPSLLKKPEEKGYSDYYEYYFVGA